MAKNNPMVIVLPIWQGAGYIVFDGDTDWGY
jgi:hypothetical protein